MKEKELVKEIFNLLQECEEFHLSDKAFSNISRAKARCVSILCPAILCPEHLNSKTYDEISIIINGETKP